MWMTARGVLIDEILQLDCANAIYRHYVSWWQRHDQGRSTAFFGSGVPPHEIYPSAEQLWVSRPDMEVRRAHWSRTAENHYGLTGEEIVRPGLKRFAYRSRMDQDRFFQSVQQTHTEDDHQEHAWRGHGEGAMALLRPSWMLHGRRVVEEWGDQIDGVPVVRWRTERVVPLESPDMMGHEHNPLVMDEAEQVVFSYDPEHDVIREWHDVWGGESCSVCRIQYLAFDTETGIGEPWAIKPIEEAQA